ncbi:MAG: methyl-accepting chemotaxis protein [Bacillota bacterium]
MGFVNQSIKRQLAAMVVGSLVLLSAMLLIISYFNIKSQLTNAAEEKVQSDLLTGEAIIDAMYPGHWEVRGNQLYKGDILINDNYEAVDYIASLTKDTCTIFMGDTRVSTNVKKDNGERAVGTKVSDKVKKVVLDQGQMYIGEAAVVDKPYQTAYKPIVDASGKTIGIFYVGTPIEQFNQAFFKEFTILALIFLLVLAGVALGVRYLTGRIILSPLQELLSGVQSLQAGNLNWQVSVKGSNELAKLAAGFNEMAQTMHKLIYQVANDSSTLASQSQEMAAASQQIGAMVEEISSHTTEVAATAQQGSAAADIAVEQVDRVEENAHRGNQAVRQAVNKMGTIQHSVQGTADSIGILNQRCQSIGQIIEVIKNIAEQTNLLALNAAIEAARAGESGRGFAVVADEVRKLAEQSARAAEDITDLIQRVQRRATQAVQDMGTSAREVNEGVDIVNQAGQSLTAITEQVTEMSRMMKEIANGIYTTTQNTQELAASSDQISTSVQQLAISSQSVAQLAQDMQQTVEEFKL